MTGKNTKNERRAEPLRGSKLSQMWLDGKKGKLHPVEAKLLDACRRGEKCVVGEVRPNKATADNLVRAGFLRYLILGGCEDGPVHARGVQLSGAWIECEASVDEGSELDLMGALFPNNIAIVKSCIDGVVNIENANGKSISLEGTKVYGISGNLLSLDGSINLNHGFISTGIVDLYGAKITGSLEFDNGKFAAPNIALFCSSIEISGGVYLRNGFIANGEVKFVGAKVSGNFECCNARLNGENDALSCHSINLQGNLFLRDGFTTLGDVRLDGAQIVGRLVCTDGRFEKDLSCTGANIDGGVLLLSSNPQTNREFIAEGTVNLANATIGGNIECSKARFNCKDRAFFANRADIKGDVSFDDARILGTVALTGAQIEGGLSFNRTRLNGKPSLQLRNSAIAGTLFWRDLKAVDGDVDLAGASCKTISFDRKSWQHDFDKPKAENNGDATSESSVNGEAQKLEDKPVKRPDTKLDNFTYQGFNNLPSKADGKFWIDWLKVQPEEHLGNNFRPKPWAQLAGVLESMGYDGEAKKVLVEREWMLTRFMARHDPEDSTSSIFSFSWARVLWRRIWGWTIDFGYQPLKALWFLTLVILMGFGIFYWASLQGIMAPTHPLIFKEARSGGSIDKACARNWVWFEDKKCSTQMPTEYSEFASFFYSADVALPIINLRQQEDWSPRVVDSNGKRIWSGYFVRLWEWLATVLGWVLSLMFVSAVGGFIRR